MGRLTHEEQIIRIKVIMNNLKSNINPSLENKLYQEWKFRNELDKNYKFRDWVIENTKKEIFKLLDENECNEFKIKNETDNTT